MAERKKEVHRVQMTEGKRNIIRQLLEKYDIQSAEDIQEIVSILFRKIKILPFGYDIRLQIFLHFEKMIHVHVMSGVSRRLKWNGCAVPLE